MPSDPAAALAAADAHVLAESERAERTRDDRRYADAITALHDLVLRNPGLPEGRLLLHSHRAQYLTFQAGRTTDQRKLHLLYAETERELRAAVAVAPPPGERWARECAALGLLLAAGAEQGEPDRTDEGVRLLREALDRGKGLPAPVHQRIRLDLATALTIRSRRHHTGTDREEAQSILATLPPDDPAAGALRAELGASVPPPGAT
jgi:hypothetical protein